MFITLPRKFKEMVERVYLKYFDENFDAIVEVINGNLDETNVKNSQAVDGLHAYPFSNPQPNALIGLNGSAKLPDSVLPVPLPNTLANVVTNHNKSQHDALGIDAASLGGKTASATPGVDRIPISNGTTGQIDFDAHTVDGLHAKTHDHPTAGALLALDGSAKIPNAVLRMGHGNGINADTVDNLHANNTANNLPVLDSNACIPLVNINPTLTGKSADMLDGYHASQTPTVGQNRVPVTQTTGKLHQDFIEFPVRGATVYRASPQSIATSFSTTLLWTHELYDTDSIHSIVTNTSRLTVPTGVSFVRVKAQVTWTLISSGELLLYIVKNGAAFIGQPLSSVIANGILGQSQSITSSILPVSSGDYFEACVAQYSGTNKDCCLDQYRSWFALEILK
jgi:hypothetical protein